MSKVHEVADHITDCNEKYDFGEAGRALYDLFWGEFADWYLEASKTRLYGARERVLLWFVLFPLVRLALRRLFVNTA